MNPADKALRRLTNAVAEYEAEVGIQSNGLRRYVDDIKALTAGYRESQGRWEALEKWLEVLQGQSTIKVVLGKMKELKREATT